MFEGTSFTFCATVCTWSSPPFAKLAVLVATTIISTIINFFIVFIILDCFILLTMQR